MPVVSWSASPVLCSLLSFTVIKHAVFHCLIVKGIQQRSLSPSLLPASEQSCVSLFAQPPLEQSIAVSECGHSCSKIDPLLFFWCPVVPTAERSAPVIVLCSAARACASGACFLSPIWSRCKSLPCPQKQQRQISSLVGDASDCFPTMAFLFLHVQPWMDSAASSHPPSIEQCLAMCCLRSELISCN